jgi:hypothetical protein
MRLIVRQLYLLTAEYRAAEIHATIPCPMQGRIGESAVPEIHLSAINLIDHRESRDAF